MHPTTQRIASLLALFLVVSISQVGIGFAAPETATAVNETPAPQVQSPAGILTTVGNKPITVNDAASITGATILSGATIETPDGVSATVSLNPRGSLEIEQHTKLTLNFQVKHIKVVLFKGCVTLHTRKGTLGEIETSKDMVSKTDPKKDDVLRVCHPDSVMEASAVVAGPALNLLSMLGVIAAPAATVVPAVLPGSNPSNSSPE